jgi:hypothetical protein
LRTASGLDQKKTLIKRRKIVLDAARSVRSLWRRLGIEPPEDVIAGMVGDPDAKRSAFTIGMAGISPAMTIPREWDVL